MIILDSLYTRYANAIYHIPALQLIDYAIYRIKKTDSSLLKIKKMKNDGSLSEDISIYFHEDCDKVNFTGEYAQKIHKTCFCNYVAADRIDSEQHLSTHMAISGNLDLILYMRHPDVWPWLEDINHSLVIEFQVAIEYDHIHCFNYILSILEDMYNNTGCFNYISSYVTLIKNMYYLDRLSKFIQRYEINTVLEFSIIEGNYKVVEGLIKRFAIAPCRRLELTIMRYSYSVYFDILPFYPSDIDTHMKNIEDHYNVIMCIFDIIELDEKFKNKLLLWAMRHGTAKLVRGLLTKNIKINNIRKLYNLHIDISTPQFGQNYERLFKPYIDHIDNIIELQKVHPFPWTINMLRFAIISTKSHEVHDILVRELPTLKNRRRSSRLVEFAAGVNKLQSVKIMLEAGFKFDPYMCMVHAANYNNVEMVKLIYKYSKNTIHRYPYVLRILLCKVRTGKDADALNYLLSTADYSFEMQELRDDRYVM